MRTGDGIERVSGADALLAPVGGEGGSVPQALGSKAEERAKRRKAKKDSYAEYLESSTWRKIRTRALKRDGGKCRGCGNTAHHVHHIRYPKKLGDERLDWLYSVCAPCHAAIHEAAKTMPLRHATNLILNAPEKVGNVTYLPDDWRLSKTATKSRQGKKTKRRTEPRKKKRKTRNPPLHVVADNNKKRKIEQENDDLRAFFQANRERRERRNFAP